MRRLALALTLLLPATLPAPALAEDAGFLTRLLQDQLSDAGREVRIRGFEGALSSQARIAEMTIADDSGVWLTLRDAELDWNRGALLRRQLAVNELSAAEIILDRLPEAGPGAAPSPEATPFALPELPLRIEIEAIRADRVALGAPVLGSPVELRLEGSARLVGGDGSTRLLAERIDGAEGRLSLAGSFDNASRMLELDLDLTEGPSGIAATLIGLPGEPPLRLAVQGDGPLSDFGADLALETEGQPRLTGRVELAATAEGQGFSALLSGDVRPLFEPEFRGFFGPDTRLDVAGVSGDDGALTLSRLELAAEELELSGQLSLAPGGLPEQVSLTGRVGGHGAPVLLPLSGPRTTVQEVALDIALDRGRSEDWTADIRLDGLDRPDFAARSMALTAEGRLATGPTRIEGRLGLSAEGLAPADPDLAAALGTDVTGGARIDWVEGAPLRIEDLALEGAQYGLAGAAVIDGQTVTTDLTARLEDLARFSGLAGRALSGAAEAQVSGDLALLDGAFDLALALVGTDIGLDQPEADRLLAGEARMEGRLRRDFTGTFIEGFEVEAQQLSALVDGVIRSAGADLTADFELADLAVLGPDYAGRLTAEARLAVDGDVQLVTATATGQDLALGIDELDRLLRGQSAVELDAQVIGGTAFIRRLSLGATTLALEAEGRVGPAGTDLTGRLDFSDLSVLGPEYGGQLTGDLRLLEAAGTQAIRFAAEGRDISLGVAEADALLSGDSRLELQATRSADEIDIERFALATQNGLDAEGSGRIAAAGSDFTGRAVLADLGVLREEFAGALSVEGSVADANGVQRIDAALTARDLALGVPEADRLLAGQTRAQLLAALEGGGVTLERLDLATATGLTAIARGRLEEGASDVEAEARFADLGVLGPQYGGSLAADLTFAEAGPLRQVALTALGQDVTVGVAEADRLLAGQTRAVLQATLEGEVVTLQALDLGTATGLTANARGRLEAGASDLDVAARLDSLSALGPQYGGSLDADLAFTEAGEERRLSLSARGQNLSVGVFEVDRLLAGSSTVSLEASQLGERLRVRGARLATPLLTAEADATVEGDRRRLDLNARLADLAALVPGFDGPVTVQGNITDANAESYTVDLSGTGPGGLSATVEGRVARDLTAALAIRGTGNLGLANRFTDPINIQGPLNFDLRLDGQPGLGALSGTASTSGARLVVPATAVTLEEISASASLGAGVAQIQAQAAVQDGGSLSAGGQVQLADRFPADLSVTLNSVRLTDRRIFATAVSGGLQVGGPLIGGGRITGALSLADTEIRIPSTGLGVGGYVPAQILHVGDSAAVRTTRARARVNGDTAAGNGGNPFDLDITLSSPNRVFVRGRGLDAELGGGLRLTGTTQDVVPAGEFGLIRGRLDILGRRFVLSDGLARLTGRFIPFLQLTATTTTDGITAQIVVEGEADELDIRFLSVPELPEEEVVARILFGRGLDRLSPFQAAQLASAVATLAGRGGEGLVGGLRRGFGLDDLDITTQDDGTAALRLGRYLTENIYTDVTVDSEGRSEVSINLDLSESVTVRARTDSDGRSGLGVFFERDY